MRSSRRILTGRLREVPTFVEQSERMEPIDKPARLRWVTHPLTIIATLFLTVLLLLLAFWGYQESQLHARLEELRAQGLPTTGEELNAFYAVPAGVADSTELWIKAIHAGKLTATPGFKLPLPFVGPDDKDPPRRNAPWPELDVARTFVKSHESERQLILDAAAAGGRVRFPVDFRQGLYTLLPDTQDTRAVARFMMLDAHVSMHDHDDQRALADLKTTFQLAEVLGGEPMIISQLVRYSIFSLVCHETASILVDAQWSDEGLAHLQEVIQRPQFTEDFIRSLQGEQGWMLEASKGLPRGPIRLWGRTQLLKNIQVALDLGIPDWKTAKARLDERHRQFRGQWTNRIIAQLNLVDNDYDAVYQPVQSTYFMALFRNQARQRSLNAIIAAQRHRLRQGTLPESLSAIDPDLIGPPEKSKELLTDPFDLAPLRFKSEPDRIIIYSVSDNLKDDGGKITSSNVIDLGYELWK